MKHGHDIVADSRFIIKYIQNTYGSQLKVHEPRDAASQAISTLIQRMCEEHMYFTSQYHRMVNPQVCAFAMLPPQILMTSLLMRTLTIWCDSQVVQTLWFVAYIFAVSVLCDALPPTAKKWYCLPSA